MYFKELHAMVQAAKKAQIEILKIYETNFDVEIKEDNSPVTKADKIADKIIKETLHEEFPDYGFLTEESVDTEERLSKQYVFIIDPVDGTKEFVKKNGQFTTNIALAKNGEVVAGVINVPAQGILYYATLGDGAYKISADGVTTKIHTNNKLDNLLCLNSISFMTDEERELIAKYSDYITRQETCGASMKFCKIAEGSAEISYRKSSGTKEWDVAAGDIILSEAGGLMLKYDGTRIKYNKKDVYNHGGYVLVNRIENFRV